MNLEKIKVVYNFRSNQFDVFEIENEELEIKKDNLVISGSIIKLVDEVIENSIWYLVNNKLSRNPIIETFFDTKYVSIVKKSSTKKSVFQFNLNGDMIGINYNLPEKFREKSFSSILAHKVGPFTTKKISNKYIEVEPWSYYEVFFIGNAIECIYEFEKLRVRYFLGYHIQTAIIEALKCCNGIRQE